MFSMESLPQIVYIVLIAAAVILALRIFTLPIRLFFRLLWSTLVGYLLLFLFNAVGSLIGLTLSVNTLTAVIVGVLGIPGLILLLLVRWLYLYI